MSLAPRERKVVRFSIEVALPDAPPLREGDFTARLSDLRRDYERGFAGATDIFTDSEQITAVLRRGQADLRMLTIDTPYGRTIAAAVPWFVAPFGRDAIIASLETLMLDSRPAVDCVRLLTRLQGRTDNAFREEEPGKILHELRQGELAALKAIPHTPYYGSVDTTALYLLLVCEVVMWTGDLEFFELLRDPIEAALRWIDESGDLDGDGFVEYRRRSRAGLENQGWRDAREAIVHRDGTAAEGPIALAETQAYVYYAKRRLASLFGQLGDVELSERLQAETRRSSCASTSASGWTTKATWRWPSTARSARSRPSARRPATACGRGSSPTSTCRRWSSSSWAPTCSRAGACARWPSRRPATVR